MIRHILAAFTRGVQYTKRHPNIVMILSLLLLLPLLFLYSGQQFLEVSRSNQETLEKNRLGLFHDVFATFLPEAIHDPVALTAFISSITTTNPDITALSVVEQVGQEYRIVAADDIETIGTTVTDPTLLKHAAIRLDESLIFEYGTGAGRRWQAFRAVSLPDGTIAIIALEISRAGVDAVFAVRERQAYWSLALVYLFIIGLAYWHVRMNDYRYLYTEAKKRDADQAIFTSMIVHELRAPLTAIRGYVSLMIEDKAVDDVHRPYLDNVNTAATRLLAVVNDFLEVSQMQSGKLSIAMAEGNLANIISNVLTELSAHAAERSIVLENTVSEAALPLTTDSKRLHQVLVNLVNNAIKYTPPGGKITLSVHDRVSQYEIRIKDTGYGIHIEDQKKLFAPFARVGGEESLAMTGSGLGMWITKQLVELLGGTIGIESIKDVGTNVVILLPKSTRA